MRNGDELGPGAVAINANALGVWTEVAAAGETVPAMTAGDVAFADDEIAGREPFHMIANKIDNPDKFVANGHWHGDRFLRPGVPVLYMYVGAAD